MSHTRPARSDHGSEPGNTALCITREEAIALLSLCMLAPDAVDPVAERGLMKLADACRAVLADDLSSVNFRIGEAAGEQPDN